MYGFDLFYRNKILKPPPTSDLTQLSLFWAEAYQERIILRIFLLFQVHHWNAGVFFRFNFDGKEIVFCLLPTIWFLSQCTNCFIVWISNYGESFYQDNLKWMIQNLLYANKYGRNQNHFAYGITSMTKAQVIISCNKHILSYSNAHCT